MSDLDLLWQLQKHDNSLMDLNERLDFLERGEKIKEIEKTMNITELKLRDLKIRMDHTEKELIRNNFMLKDMDYKLREIEKELYDGNIIDLRQLSHLDKEKDLLRKEIDNKEIEILTQMEEIEKLKKDFSDLELEFEDFKLEYLKLKKEYNELIEKIKEEIIKNTGLRQEIAFKIDSNVLSKYEQIKKTKNNIVVEIIDNKCSGCNVLLPTLILDKLKFQDEIIYCDNCGRILYYEK